MSEHFSTTQVENYLQKRMTPAELLAADDHLFACTDCRERLLLTKKPERVVAQVRASLKDEARAQPAHLSYEQLAAYVDDAANDLEREIVDSHLTVCHACKEEMRDLFAFREVMTTAPLAESDAPATLSQRVLSFIKTAFTRPAFQLAGGVAALALVAFVLWSVWKSSTNVPRPQEIVQTQPSPRVEETIAAPSSTPAPLEQRAQENANAGTTLTPAPKRTVRPPQDPAPLIKKQGAQSESVVALNDGARKVSIDTEGRVRGLETLSPAEQDAVRTALLRGRAPSSSELEGLGARGGERLMGAPGASSFGLQGPVGVVVRTETPTFRWNALEGASHYTVNVFDSGFNRVMTSGPVNKTEWTATRPLTRGTLYVWQVTASVNGKEIQAPAPPAPEARFRVMSRAQAESIERGEKLYAGSHLMLGLLYSRAGLLDEAEREFRALVAANPDSQAAQRLLKNIELLKAR